jgi:aminodeoxyfutalosine synthase
MADGVIPLDGFAGKVDRGEALQDDEAAALLETKDLIAVGALADEARRRRYGNRTTFGRVLEVPLAAVPAALPPGASFGELRIVGAPANPDEAARAVAAARALAPAAPLTAFSLADLERLASTSRPIDAILRDLRSAGLDAVAEVPVDLVREGADSVRRARAAGLQALRLTVHALDEERRLDPVRAARELQKSVGGFAAFAPLPRTWAIARPATGYDDMKLVAVARLMSLDVPSIQVDWPLYGPKLAQVALTVGADDVDGVACDEGTSGARRSPLEEIRGNIRAAGQEPVARDGLFRPLSSE